MAQEDRIISTGREAIESLRDDYREFNQDPDVSFEEFAGDVLDIFEKAPDAAFAYDAQMTAGSIERLPEPSRLMSKVRNCTNPHDMVRYALAAEWIERDHAELIPFLTDDQLGRITVELAVPDRVAAAEILGDEALKNVTGTYGPVWDAPGNETSQEQSMPAATLRGRLEYTLGDEVSVTDAAGTTRTVRIGSHVTLDESDGTRFRFRVIAVAEPDPRTGMPQCLIDETAVDHPMDQATWGEWSERPSRNVFRLEHQYSDIKVDLPKYQVGFDAAATPPEWHGPGDESWPVYDWFSSSDNYPTPRLDPDPSVISCVPGIPDDPMSHASGLTL